MSEEQREYIFEDFKTMFPRVAERAVDCYGSGQLELIVELSDGTKLIYDYISKTFEEMKVSAEEAEKMDAWTCEFARRLDRRLSLAGMSVVELSNRTNISRQTLGKYTHGQALPTITNLFAIAEALDCKPAELIDF